MAEPEQWEYCRIVLKAATAYELNVVDASTNLGKSFNLPGRAESLDSVLATLGQEGWELIGNFEVVTGIAQMVLKRRKQP